MDDTLRILMILVPAMPLLAAMLVAVLGPRILRGQSHWPVVLAIVASLLGSLVLLQHVRKQPVGYERIETYWTWGVVGDAYRQSADASDAAGG